MSGDLFRELEEGRVRPAYLVAGGEPLLRDRAVAAIRAAVLGSGPVDFNFDRLEGDACAPARLWDAIQTLPVMAERRLVWLREPAGGRGTWKAVTECLPDVVGSLAGDGGSVLLVTAATIDRRSKWVKAFREPAALVACDPPRAGRDLVAFVRSEAKRQGVELASGAAERLAERIGPQLLVLRSELEKAALFAGPGRPVTLEHVSLAVADVAEEPIWDLTDAIGEGRAGDALAVLGKLLHGGAPPPVLLGSLASHFRRLLRARSGGTVSGPPFVQRKLKAQAGRYAPARLGSCLRAIHDTDEALKGQGGLGPQLALERLVLALAA